MKIICKNCNTILEGDKKGTYIPCKCGKCAIDETEYYCRIIGNQEDWSEILPLTKKQKEIYEKIKEFIDANGYSPSIRELCQLCNLSSSATMFVHLQKIKAKGYIDFMPKKFRTIKILLDA